MNATWKIKDNNVFFCINDKDLNLEFPIPKQIIPYLLTQTPKIFFLKVRFRGKEYQTLIDLSDLIYKPMQQQRKLKIVFRTSDRGYEQAQDGFSLARGESYKDRFLSYQGWQQQEFFFPIKIQSAENQKDNQKEPKELKSEKTTQKLIVCPFCGAILLEELDYCPICKRFIGQQDKNADITL